MTDTSNQGASSNGDGASPDAGTPPPAVSAPTEKAAMVRDALTLLKEHPLGAVATVAAATALLELEFAVGILAGLSATALLSNKSGPERRKIVLERGKWALERARAMKETAMKRKAPSSAQPVPPTSPV